MTSARRKQIKWKKWVHRNRDKVERKIDRMMGHLAVTFAELDRMKHAYIKYVLSLQEQDEGQETQS